MDNDLVYSVPAFRTAVYEMMFVYAIQKRYKFDFDINCIFNGTCSSWT